MFQAFRRRSAWSPLTLAGGVNGDCQVPKNEGPHINLVISAQRRSSRLQNLRRRLYRRALRHYLPLAVCTVVSLSGGVALLTPPSLTVRLTIASAYLALVLLVATLLVSPLTIMWGRRTSPSSDLRRDLGIWAGGVSLAHVGLGLWARFGQSAYDTNGLAASLIVLGATLFGVAAGELIIVLLALSNDMTLRHLGLPRWKRLQRLARWLPALVSAHSVFWLVLAGHDLALVAAVVAFAITPEVARLLIAGTTLLRTRAARRANQ